MRQTSSLQAWSFQTPARSCIKVCTSQGALHVVDNLQKDLGEKLHHYASHVRSLKLFQPLLGDRDYRERLQWTCLQGPYR